MFIIGNPQKSIGISKAPILHSGYRVKGSFPPFRVFRV